MLDMTSTHQNQPIHGTPTSNRDYSCSCQPCLDARPLDQAPAADPALDAELVLDRLNRNYSNGDFRSRDVALVRKAIRDALADRITADEARDLLLVMGAPSVLTSESPRIGHLRARLNGIVAGGPR